MNRNGRNGRNIRRQEENLLWTIHSEHINGGPAHDVPLTLTATPIRHPDVPDFHYIQHLVQALNWGMIGLVRHYAHVRNTPLMTTPEIRALPIFFFPLDVSKF